MPRRKKKNQADKENKIESQVNTDDESVLFLGSASDACQVKSSPLIGRYLVARKRIGPGETILEDEALIVGPCQDARLVCVGCCTLLKVEINHAHRCGGCGWPVCGGGCPGLSSNSDKNRGTHSKTECKLLKTITPQSLLIKESCSHESASYLNIITPLRCLLLQEEDLKSWEAVIKMESHDSIRKDIPAIWKRNQLTVVEPIKKLLPQYPEELIHTVCGILEVNCFSVGGEDIEGRALYPRAYLLQHDCTPNTVHIDNEKFTMTVKASVNIKIGAPITLTYTSTLNGTSKRRREIKESKFFDCCCPRCSSNTELGTYMSGVKCLKCPPGWILPLKPLVNNSDWKCNKCENIIPAKMPETITEMSCAEFEKLKDAKVKDYEKLLTKYEKSLHPNHSTMVKIKYALSQMYGKSENYLLNNMSEDMLQKKYDICKQLLGVFDVIEPGITRIRGVTLYEAHAPLLLLTQTNYMKGKLTKKQVNKEFNRIREMLSESVTILAMEGLDSSEGQMCQAAKQALELNWTLT